MNKYVPGTRSEWCCLIVLLCACAGVVVWMWDALVLAYVHWQVTLCVSGGLGVMVLSKLGTLDRQHQHVLKAIQNSSKGLTRAELATALHLSKPEALDGVVSYLLEHEQIEWRQSKEGIVLQVCEGLPSEG